MMAQSCQEYGANTVFAFFMGTPLTLEGFGLLTLKAGHLPNPSAHKTMNYPGNDEKLNQHPAKY